MKTLARDSELFTCLFIDPRHIQHTPRIRLIRLGKEMNHDAGTVRGSYTICTIARVLVATVSKNTIIDWTIRENVRANLRVLVKRVLRKYGYPPD